MSTILIDLINSIDEYYVDNVLYSLVILAGYMFLRKLMKFLNSLKPFPQRYRRNDPTLAQPFIDLPSYDPMILRFSFDIPLLIFIVTFLIDG